MITTGTYNEKYGIDNKNKSSLLNLRISHIKSLSDFLVLEAVHLYEQVSPFRGS